MRCRAVPVTVGGAMAIKLGLTRIKPIEASKPTARPATAPVVLNLRQKIDSTITGKFAEAATAKDKATRNATLAVGPRRMAMLMAIAPTTKAEIRATRTSSPGFRSISRRITLVRKSWVKVVEGLLVSTAPTARMATK